MLAPPDDALAFELQDSHNHDVFHRSDRVAAHVVASSGRAPRLVMAFPAGNAGAGLWFEALPEPAALHVERPLVPVTRHPGVAGVIAAVVSAAPELRVRRAILANIRTLRRFSHGVEPPAALSFRADAGPPLTLHRTLLDGRLLSLIIEPQGDGTARFDGDHLVLRSGGGPLRFHLTALTDERPLTPIPAGALLRDGAAADTRALSALAFLAYEEKLLAGSWRFLTYFGRDTLCTLLLLLPALRPEVIEAGLGAVLDRLDAGGEVAHEEAVGEEAVAQNMAAGRVDLTAPVLDHEMIDDDFLLAPVAARYLLDHADPERARAFLARRTPVGEPYRAALGRNLALVLRRARTFMDAPGVATLVALRPDRLTGDWRDSLEGLGGGRVPYGVNAALVPAALTAAARLLESHLYDGDRETAARAEHKARRFAEASALFQVTVPAELARERVRAHAVSLDIDPAPALASLDGDLRFPALALDPKGATVDVMHSDEGFVLLLGEPPPEELAETARRLVRPFPAGLFTPVGMLVANPALAADPALRALFTPRHYHGAVVWSWQQALLRAGLERQLTRRDLPPHVRAAVETARRALAEAMASGEAWRTAELWSFTCRDGRWEHIPFGAAGGHQTESNAAQLWSTVWLGAA
jgi:hypothetical protein